MAHCLAALPHTSETRPHVSGVCMFAMLLGGILRYPTTIQKHAKMNIAKLPVGVNVFA